MTVVERFTAGQAVKLSGVPYPRLDYWIRTGFLTPSIELASGTGSDRGFSFADVLALRVAQRLREAGVPLQSLRKAVERIRRMKRLTSSTEALASTYLVSDGRDVFEKTGDQLVSMLRKPGQIGFAWLIDLGGIVREIREKMAA
jgi:DNA-binding transcriptional MerR regulator